jgi:hypothetical protein
VERRSKYHHGRKTAKIGGGHGIMDAGGAADRREARPPSDGGKRGRRGRLIIRRPKTVVEGGEAVENRGGGGRGESEEEGCEGERRLAGTILKPKKGEGEVSSTVVEAKNGSKMGDGNSRTAVGCGWVGPPV